MSQLYLMGIQADAEGARNATLRGVRCARALTDQDASLRPALELVQRFLDDPRTALLVASHEDAEVLRHACEKATEYSAGLAKFEVDPESLELPEPEGWEPGDEDEPEDERNDGPFSPAAYRTAIAMMQFAHGDQNKAWAQAYLLRTVTDDESLYQEVCDVITSIFPPTGPNIVIVQ